MSCIYVIFMTNQDVLSCSSPFVNIHAIWCHITITAYNWCMQGAQWYSNSNQCQCQLPKPNYKLIFKTKMSGETSHGRWTCPHSLSQRTRERHYWYILKNEKKMGKNENYYLLHPAFRPDISVFKEQSTLIFYFE